MQLQRSLPLAVAWVFVVETELTQNSEKFVEEETPDWAPHNRKVCSGTRNGLTMVGKTGTDLRKMYENCTRVRGNLEITHLDRNSMGISTSEMLKIFQNIEEVKGYVLIDSVDTVDLLWFPRLKIIHGEELFKEDAGKSGGSALWISGNSRLRDVQMPELRSIQKGTVFIESRKFLCHLVNKVNWKELLGLDESRLIIDKSSKKNCGQYINKTICNSSCSSGYCWGSSSNLCQQLYRVNCSQKPEKLSTLCYFNETESAYKYCHSECKGGCTGGQNTDCLACKNFKLGQACVNQCPKTYTKDGLKTRPNKDGTYVLVMDCVKQCPRNMLIQGDDCVSACADGFYHDATEKSRRCKDCPKNGCPKNCTVTKNLTKNILAGLEGCTVVTGFIAIRQDSGLTEADLAVLRNVTVITEYLHIERTNFSNFSFLENLETIEGRELGRDKFALVVVDNNYLKELGWKKLKGITYGDVCIKRNTALCVFPTFNWAESLVPKTSNVIIMDQMDKEQCKEENRGCHKECKGEGGCRGRGPANCLECKSWKENDSCVSNCSREGFYEEKETMQCRPCFEECLQCTGPNETDCSSCRNVAVQEDTRLVCLKECGNRQYAQSGFCYPCHESCYEHGCSGPMDKLGQGGCNKCRYGLVDYNKVSRCLFTDGIGEKICLENNLTSYDFSPLNIEGTTLGHCTLPTMPLWKILVIISVAVLLLFGVSCMISKCYIRQKKRKEPRDIEEMPLEENSEESVGRIKMILLTELTLGNEIGRGNFGTVHKGSYRPTKYRERSESYSVAVKMVNSVEEEGSMLDEGNRMASLKHPHLLPLSGICMADGVRLVTPFRKLGNLKDYLKNNQSTVTGKDQLLYCYQIASAMKYLANHRVVHRDLAARNILVKEHNHVEVSDFGMSNILPRGEDTVAVEDKKIPIKWTAPEVWRNRIYTFESDVWAYGITCWEIITYGEEPYPRLRSFEELDTFLVKQGDRLPQPNHCSNPFYTFILRCWQKDPERRPSFGVLDYNARKFYESTECYIQQTRRVSFDHLDQDVGLDEIELTEMQRDDEELGLGTSERNSVSESSENAYLLPDQNQNSKIEKEARRLYNVSHALSEFTGQGSSSSSQQENLLFGQSNKKKKRRKAEEDDEKLYIGYSQVYLGSPDKEQPSSLLLSQA